MDRTSVMPDPMTKIVIRQTVSDKTAKDIRHHS